MSAPSATEPTRTEPALRTVFAPYFRMGFGTGVASGERAALARHHASSLSCENDLKVYSLRPGPDLDAFDWRRGDAWVDWAGSMGVEIVGHTLVWGYKHPDWLLDRVRNGSLDKAAALAWQDAHIRAVLGRYGDRIHTWDVVNEALSDGPEDGPLLRSDPWSDLTGTDYIIAAFKSARAVAPKARLIYNDYNLEHPSKRARLFKLLAILEAAGCRPDAIGIQGHCNIYDEAPALLDTAIPQIHAAGYPVHITELDVSIYAWKGGANLQINADEATDPGHQELPPELAKKLTERYRELFGVFLRHADKIERVTFWNIDDGASWLNNWPVKGRRNHPLLFDAQQRPKSAFHAVIGLVPPASVPSRTAPTP